MPLYEYGCRVCGHRFEHLRPMASADDPAPCPRCGTEKTGRLVSTFVSYSTKGNDPLALAAGGGCGCSLGGCGCH